MSKPKYTITHAGQVFTRHTNRVYTHVILGNPDYTKELEYAVANARASASQANYDFRVREAGPNARWEHAGEEAADIQRVASLTRQQWEDELVATATARLEKKKAAGAFDRIVAITWCGRQDLMVKAVARAVKTGEYTKVFAIATSETDKGERA